MPRYLKILLHLATLLIAAGSTQATSYAINRECKEATFSGTINGGQEFTSQISSNLEVQLEPQGKNEGWNISVRPHGSDDDWTLPVNLPISGEAQNLGTGWAMTAEASLSEPHSLRFVLTQAEYDHYWQLAYGSHGPNSRANFIEKIGKAKAGKILFTPLDHQNDGSPETVKWLRFTITVTVPKYFETVGLSWRVVSCAGHLPIGPN